MATFIPNNSNPILRLQQKDQDRVQELYEQAYADESGDFGNDIISAMEAFGEACMTPVPEDMNYHEWGEKFGNLLQERVFLNNDAYFHRLALEFAAIFIVRDQVCEKTDARATKKWEKIRAIQEACDQNVTNKEIGAALLKMRQDMDYYSVPLSVRQKYSPESVRPQPGP